VHAEREHLPRTYIIDERPPPPTWLGNVMISRKSAVPRALKMPKMESIWL